MQSWQTDLLNTYLSYSVKPALRHISSIRAIRAGVSLVDGTLGRLAHPGRTITEPLKSPSGNCDYTWVETETGKDISQRVILYLPGGAYIIRTPQAHTAMVSRICKEANASALMCFYRLAPEHPFPAAIEDAVEAYDFLLARGHRPQDIAVAGDSAGGGLAMSLMLAIRDSKRPLPGCTVLLSPLLDAGDHAPSRTKNSRSDTALPSPAQRAVNPRELYAGGHDYKDPLISPIYGTFEDLPPIYVLVSDAEMLLDDSLRLARKAHLYRTEVRVDVWRKVPHVWVVMSFLPESKDGIQRIAKFMAEHIPASTNLPEDQALAAS